jgi:co-chaperonin GroES (HSP10)
MTIRGKLKPLHDKVIISDMNFGMEKTKSGIFLHSDDGKSSGIHPRWGKVFAVGPAQKDVEVGQWILLEHGRWSRGHQYEDENGEIVDIRLADNNAILCVSDEAPDDALRVNIGALNLNVPDAQPN